MNTTNPIIKLEDNHISYKPGYHGYVPRASGGWSACNILSDETFIRLWYQCKTIEQFVDSYRENHEYSYAPGASACSSRARNIGKRYGINLSSLESEYRTKRCSDKEQQREDIKMLARELELEKEMEKIGMIPPVVH